MKKKILKKIKREREKRDSTKIKRKYEEIQGK